MQVSRFRMAFLIISCPFLCLFSGLVHTVQGHFYSALKTHGQCLTWISRALVHASAVRFSAVNKSRTCYIFSVWNTTKCIKKAPECTCLQLRWRTKRGGKCTATHQKCTCKNASGTQKLRCEPGQCSTILISQILIHFLDLIPSCSHFKARTRFYKR